MNDRLFPIDAEAETVREQLARAHARADAASRQAAAAEAALRHHDEIVAMRSCHACGEPAGAKGSPVTLCVRCYRDLPPRKAAPPLVPLTAEEEAQANAAAMGEAVRPGTGTSLGRSVGDGDGEAQSNPPRRHFFSDCVAAVARFAPGAASPCTERHPRCGCPCGLGARHGGVVHFAAEGHAVGTPGIHCGVAPAWSAKGVGKIAWREG